MKAKSRTKASQARIGPAQPRPDVDEYDSDYWARQEDEFDELSETQKIYKPATDTAAAYMKREFFWFVSHKLKKDPIVVLRELPLCSVSNFFNWFLHTRRATCRSASSLQTYWNVFALMRRQETGCHLPIEPQMKSQMRAVRQRLVKRYALRTEGKEKPIVRAEDQFNLLQTLWSDTRMSFKHELQRAQLALLMHLGGITGNRPSALLALRYRNLQVALIPDPGGNERPRVLIDLTFAEQKSYLGPKATNTFGVPDVPSEPCLLLCPQTAFLAIAFADKAFAAPALKGPKELFSLQIPAGSGQLRLPFKEDMKDQPIFRKIKNDGFSVEASSECADADWLRRKLKQLGNYTGFELPVGPYTFRRGAGEAFDSSSHISDSQRNLILSHAGSAVFQHNYLSRYVTSDTQAAYRNIEPQTAVMRVASGMTRSIDVRRPHGLTEDQRQQISRDADVRLLTRTKDRKVQRIKDQYGTIVRSEGTALWEELQSINADIRAAKRQAHKKLLEQAKATFRKQQPIADIQAQLIPDTATSVSVESDEEDSGKPKLSLERQRVLAALFTFASKEANDEVKRRSEAINAMAVLCGCSEPVVHEVCRRKRRRLPASDDATMSDEFPLACQPTQCIFCMGQEGLSLDQRLHSFHSRADLRKHIFRKHLDHLEEGSPFTCPHPKCYEEIQNTGHLQNHAARVHGTPT